MSDITVAKDIGKGSAELVSNINKFNVAMNIGKDSCNSKGINNIIELLSDSSLSKISAGIGCLSAAISLVSLFSGAKSSEEIILDMLGNISDKIDSLQSLMLSRFDRLEAVVERVSVNATLNESFKVIGSAITTLDGLLKSKTDAQRKQAINNLRKIDFNALRVAVAGIDTTVTVQSWQNSVYSANLRTTYGDLDVIQSIGRTLNYYILSAQLLECAIKIAEEFPDSLLCTIASDDGHTFLDDLQNAYDAQDAKNEQLEKINAINTLAEEYYSVYLNRHTQSWTKALKEVLENAPYYMDLYCTEKLLPMLDAKNHSGAVHHLVNSLSKQWGWLDFFAVVYNDVHGTKKHSINGYLDFHLEYFHHNINGGKANVFFTWKDKDETALGSTRNSTVSYSYGDILNQLPSANAKQFTYKGAAEKFNLWRDLDEVDKSLVSSKSNDHRLTWACRKNCGVSRAQTDEKRVFWANGKYLDFAVFE